MNLYTKFILAVIISIVISVFVTRYWMKFSLYIGAILKKRYIKNRLAFSDFDNSSYHSGNQRQQCDQQIKSTNSVKGFYKVNHNWIMLNIDRVFEPLYRHLNSSPNKNKQDTKTSPKDNSGNLKSLVDAVHSDTNANIKELECQPKKNDTDSDQKLPH